MVSCLKCWVNGSLTVIAHQGAASWDFATCRDRVDLLDCVEQLNGQVVGMVGFEKDMFLSMLEDT